MAIQEEERRNPKEGVLPPKPGTLIMSQVHIFKGNRKWAQNGPKCNVLCSNPMFFTKVKASSPWRSHVSSIGLVFLRLGKPKSGAYRMFPLHLCKGLRLDEGLLHLGELKAFSFFSLWLRLGEAVLLGMF